MVLPAPSVSVPVPVVIVLPLIVVAVAAPIVGVVSVGDVPNTKAPEPVSSVIAVARFALLGVARNVPMPVAGVIPAQVSRSVSQASTFVPITNPKVVRA